MSFYTKGDAENAMAKLSGSKIGSRTVRCGWAHHKKDAMQNIDYTTVDQVNCCTPARPYKHDICMVLVSRWCQLHVADELPTPCTRVHIMQGEWLLYA